VYRTQPFPEGKNPIGRSTGSWTAPAFMETLLFESRPAPGRLDGTSQPHARPAGRIPACS